MLLYAIGQLPLWLLLVLWVITMLLLLLWGLCRCSRYDVTSMLLLLMLNRRLHGQRDPVALQLQVWIFW